MDRGVGDSRTVWRVGVVGVVEVRAFEVVVGGVVGRLVVVCRWLVAGMSIVMALVGEEERCWR